MSSKKAESAHAAAGPVAESLFGRLVVAPFLFVSFLISLVLIDRQTSGTVFGKPAGKSDYYHSHQRKLAKREMDNAFQMRSKVLAGMVVLVAVAVAIFAWSLESIWRVWQGGAVWRQ